MPFKFKSNEVFDAAEVIRVAMRYWLDVLDSASHAEAERQDLIFALASGLIWEQARAAVSAESKVDLDKALAVFLEEDKQRAVAADCRPCAHCDAAESDEGGTA